MPVLLDLWIACLSTDDEWVLSTTLSTDLLPLQPHSHPQFLTCYKLKKSDFGLTLYLSFRSVTSLPLFTQFWIRNKIQKQGRDGSASQEWAYGHVPRK